MHELSVCQGLLAEVQRVAAAHGATEVTGLVVAIGALSGVEAPLLSRAFGVARCGTIAERAVLRIDETPVVVWCGACGAETEVPANALLCGTCGTWKVDLRSGDELLLKSVELTAEEATAAAE